MVAAQARMTAFLRNPTFFTLNNSAFRTNELEYWSAKQDSRYACCGKNYTSSQRFCRSIHSRANFLQKQIIYILPTMRAVMTLKNQEKMLSSFWDPAPITSAHLLNLIGHQSTPLRV